MKKQSIDQLADFVSRDAKKSIVTSKPNNCVVYTRVSTTQQEANFSLEIQLDQVTRYAQQKGYTILEHFGGKAESAKTDGRKEFERMLSFVLKNKKIIVSIVVPSLDRFSRSGEDAIALVSRMKRDGIRIEPVNMPTDDTAAGDFLTRSHLKNSKMSLESEEKLS